MLTQNWKPIKKTSWYFNGKCKVECLENYWWPTNNYFIFELRRTKSIYIWSFIKIWIRNILLHIKSMENFWIQMVITRLPGTSHSMYIPYTMLSPFIWVATASPGDGPISLSVADLRSKCHNCSNHASYRLETNTIRIRRSNLVT
jgi:hypothetical protein